MRHGPAVLAVVPARGGSRGIPRKNLCKLGGRSLIAWAVATARESSLVSDVIVSSEDPEILAEASCCGAAGLPRPPELATDTATTDAVLVQVMESLIWRHDLVVLLQPTVPIRPAGLVDACITRLLTTGADSLLTAYPLHFVWKRGPKHNSRHVAVNDLCWLQSNVRGQRLRRQEFSGRDFRYAEDGAVFVTRSQLLRNTGNRIGGRVEVYPTERTIDIDTPRDLRLAEAMLTALQIET